MSNIQDACQASGSTENEHSLLNAILVEHPLDYLTSLLDTADIFIRYSECKVNTTGILKLGTLLEHDQNSKFVEFLHTKHWIKTSVKKTERTKCRKKTRI